MKVVLTYRVLQHWRVPVFRRLSQLPNIEFKALHGSDFAGTKVVNGKDLTGVDHLELPTLRITVPSGGGTAHFPLCPTLIPALIRERPDVILAEGGSNLLNNLFVYTYALLSRTPVVWWTLGELREQEKLALVQRMFRATYRWMERRSTALLGYSSIALRYFERLGFPAERCFRAVNCVDTDQILADLPNAVEGVDALRAAHDLEGKKVLLFVGALIPAKRLEDLISSYVELRKRHDDVRLVIVGGGTHQPALERHRDEVGADGVIFTGQVVDGVGSWFEVGDVFVLPGLGGLAVSEAMAHSLPVLATEADGCEVDLVEEGKNGFLLPVGDVERLTACLDELLSDPARLDAMSRHSRWIIDNRFNIHTYMENVIAALRYAGANRSN